MSTGCLAEKKKENTDEGELGIGVRGDKGVIREGEEGEHGEGRGVGLWMWLTGVCIREREGVSEGDRNGEVDEEGSSISSQSINPFAEQMSPSARLLLSRRESPSLLF